MPKIFDNIENHLVDGLKKTLEVSYKSDFCVGYFNLRGWKNLSQYVDGYFGTEESCCRLLIGMQRPSEDILKEFLSKKEVDLMDAGTASAMKKRLASEFREQLMFGIPTSGDEEGLKKLADQLRTKKVVVKLFLRHTLHAKLYLLHRQDNFTPLIGYVGSSNLTLSGLQSGGELNLDVVEQDAAVKLSKWFQDRWNDRYCLDITEELAKIIEESWAGDKPVKPYFIYLKVAYHLSQEAQLGLNNYIIPKVFANDLLPFQTNAVLLAARHLDKRGGVLIGDVVGLGKTITACALAKVFEESFYIETLVICPKNLKGMWDDYLHRYGIRGKVHSISQVNEKFLEERRYRLVIIDESHNLRNRDGKRYSILKEYLEKNESKVILLTATPYNKTYNDISNQLRLFLPEDSDLGVSPERFIDSIGGAIEFVAQYQYSPNTLLAFEKSEFADDWRELLKLYMVRRTRTFIKNNYATLDPGRNQYFLTFANGNKFYFPDRVPKKVEFDFDDGDTKDTYARLYSNTVVDLINDLFLPRYGLGNYIDAAKLNTAANDEKVILSNLSKAGKRLMGFCRTNLFKRLESSGYAFLLSLARHVVRNYIFLYAIENGLPFPIGRQENEIMDEFLEENDTDEFDQGITSIKTDHKNYLDQAEKIYRVLQADKKIKWIQSSYFKKNLQKYLVEDCDAILKILKLGEKWDAKNDKKINALEELVQKQHGKEKVLIFTQFADTAWYVERELRRRGIKNLACVTGDVENPTEYAQRFSPESNKVKSVQKELRILVSTDVLSEGQNLQDSHVIVNFDLPWALIRLIQRAGRVDRIGQSHHEILCYSFLPADGVNRIIRLRERLIRRIRENAEVVGADEVFFDGDPVNIADLYNEKAGALDDEVDNEVDLTSTAYEIWNHAIKARPELKKIIPSLPNVVYSTKEMPSNMVEGEGVVCYHKTTHDIDVLTWIGRDSRIISKSQSRILKALECDYDTLPQERMDDHHKLVAHSVEVSNKEERTTGGQLGKKTGARYRTYMILVRFYEENKRTLFAGEDLKKAIDDIFKFPLRESTKDLLNRRLRIGITEEDLSSLVVELRHEGKLCNVEDNAAKNYDIPQIICSMGIKRNI